MPHQKNLSQIGILLLISVTLLCISIDSIPADNPTPTQIRIIRVPYEPSDLQTEFSNLYTQLITDTDLPLKTITLNGRRRNVATLPQESSIIQLPENRYVYQSPTKTTSILPNGTTLTYHDAEPILLVPNEPVALGATNIETYDITQLAATTTFDQTIQRLDHYILTLTLNELTNPTISQYTTRYTIDWGDKTTDTYIPTDIIATHTYTKPAIYTLTINITDSFGYLYTITQTYEITYEGHVLHAYLILEEHKEPVALTSTTSISTLTLLYIALTETGKYKALTIIPLLIPLYTRITKEDVLDQFVRGQIFGYIRTNPGVHYNQIRRAIDVKNGTLSYHLRVLEKTQLIKSRKEGLRYRAFYPTGMRFPKNERFRLTELQIDILEYITGHPGDTQRDIARALNQKPQTINYNIKVLAQADLIDVKRDGRKTGLHAKPSTADIQQLDQ